MTEDHKDRFGDKLRKKQKVDEDRYFAELDKLKIERLKREQGTERKPLADCPRCGASLVEHDHLGVLIDECPSCGGIWLDKGELELLQERGGETWVSKWFRSVLTRKR